MKTKVAALGLAAILSAFAFPALAQGTPPLERLKLPPGFAIEVFAAGVKDARSMALGEKGTLFVGTRTDGRVFAIRNDGKKATEVLTIAKGLNMPNGVAVKDGALYLAEVNRVWRYDDI